MLQLSLELANYGAHAWLAAAWTYILSSHMLYLTSQIIELSDALCFGFLMYYFKTIARIMEQEQQAVGKIWCKISARLVQQAVGKLVQD